ncbi:hypothetical protein FACS189426_16230 [Bacteroidia bacterium]|nr:hypothetical protein FACS189426_16230 [Bacteroidia bacterium]GHT84351.1 hypothetical protein FACS18947_1670 [Bacteroidia bacterium]
MQCGAIRYSVDAKAKTQAKKRNFEHYIIPCFTRFRKPFTQDETDWHITQIYSALVEDDLRNRQIATDLIEAVNAGRTPIILTQRTDHVSVLADLIKNQCNAHVITLVGADSAKQKHETMNALENIQQNDQLIIIATGKYVGEGFDYPRLDTLFLASPIAWKGTLAQYAGRLHRDYPGKQDVIAYDYVDMESISVIRKDNLYQKYVIIDERLVWYGNIGLLSFWGSEESIMRLYPTFSD